MKMFKKYRKIRLVALLALVSSTSALTWAASNLFKTDNELTDSKIGNNRTEVEASNEYDVAAMKRFAQLVQLFEKTKEEYSFSGTLKVIDIADTLASDKVTDFIVCKKGQQLYYKLENSEIINGGGLYISIDHESKKVLVSAQKIIQMAHVMDVQKMQEALRSENYEMRTKVEGNSETISLRNNEHPSCREYSISFDTLSLKVSRFYIRMADPADLRQENEKTIEIQVKEWAAKADLAKYLSSSDVLSKINNRWKLKGKYSDYNLIQL